MSEPMGVEDRARLRAEAENLKPGEFYPGTAVITLLDEVDRLTEALEAAERHRAEAVRDLLNARRAIADEWYPRAERAEADLAERDSRIEAWEGIEKRLQADLADEKRQHAETLTRTALDIDKLLLRVAGFSEPWDRGYCQGVQDAAYAVRERRALARHRNRGTRKC